MWGWEKRVKRSEGTDLSDKEVLGMVTVLMELSWGFPGGASDKNAPANAGGVGSTLVWEDPTCCRAAKPRLRNC